MLSTNSLPLSRIPIRTFEDVRNEGLRGFYVGIRGVHVAVFW
jgi:hypothetical protein